MLGNLVVYLAVFVSAWAGWSHTCEGTWGHCRGARRPPGSAVWSQIYGCRPGEPWVACWQAPEPDSTPRPGGCCLWPSDGQETLVKAALFFGSIFSIFLKQIKTNQWHTKMVKKDKNKQMCIMINHSGEFINKNKCETSHGSIRTLFYSVIYVFCKCSLGYK